MIAKISSSLSHELQLREFQSGPFSGLAHKEAETILQGLRKFGVGVLISGGETGAERAAWIASSDFGVPCAGFAPRGRINETGRISGMNLDALLVPNGRFGNLSSQRVVAELALPPYARKHHFRENRELNCEHSHAVLIVSAGDDVDGTAEALDTALRFHSRSRVLVVDISAERSGQVNRVVEWVHQVKPLALYVTGPRESHMEMCNFSVCDRTREVLAGVFTSTAM